MSNSISRTQWANVRIVGNMAAARYFHSAGPVCVKNPKETANSKLPRPWPFHDSIFHLKKKILLKSLCNYATYPMIKCWQMFMFGARSAKSKHTHFTFEVLLPLLHPVLAAASFWQAPLILLRCLVKKKLSEAAEPIKKKDSHLFAVFFFADRPSFKNCILGSGKRGQIESLKHVVAYFTFQGYTHSAKFDFPLEFTHSVA